MKESANKIWEDSLRCSISTCTDKKERHISNHVRSVWYSFSSYVEIYRMTIFRKWKHLRKEKHNTAFLLIVTSYPELTVLQYLQSFKGSFYNYLESKRSRGGGATLLSSVYVGHHTYIHVGHHTLWMSLECCSKNTKQNTTHI